MDNGEWNIDFIEELLDEFEIHGGTTAMGVQMSFSQFDGFS
jgi:hypothetical protein